MLILLVSNETYYYYYFNFWTLCFGPLTNYNDLDTLERCISHHDINNFTWEFVGDHLGQAKQQWTNQVMEII